MKHHRGCEQWQAVESSNLAAIGSREGFLVVAFKNGSVYRYPGQANRFDELLEAESKGKFFARYVRPGPAQRLCSDPDCFEAAVEHGRCYDHAD